MPNDGPQLKATITLDNKEYEAILKRSEAQAKKLSSSLARMAFKIPVAGITAATKALRGMAAVLSSVAKGGLSGAGASYLVGGWRGVGGAIADVSRRMASGVQDAYEYGREMQNFSRFTGIAIEKSAMWSQAMQDSEMNVNDLSVGMRLLNQLMLKAAEENDRARHIFNQVGLSFRELIHLPVDEAFEKVGQTIAAIKNPALQSAAALNLLGYTGARTLKLFERGGALDMAKEALGKQGGIVAGSGEGFEKIAIRLSHIGVKMRGFYVGLAQSVMGVVDKLTETFHKMDFTVWGAKLGEALKKALRFGMAVFNDPEAFVAVIWIRMKQGASSFIDWLTGAFVGAFKAAWNTLKESFESIVNGSALGKFFGKISLPSFKLPKLSLGLSETDKKMLQRWERAKLSASIDFKNNFGGEPDLPETVVQDRRGMPIRSGRLKLGSVQVASMAGALSAFKIGRTNWNVPLSGMREEAYDRTDILRHRERVRFRSMAIAARSGRILAAGGTDNQPYMGNYSDKRRPGETANGDKQRAKAFAREVARREAAQGTDIQLLGDIARNTMGTNKILTDAFN